MATRKLRRLRLSPLLLEGWLIHSTGLDVAFSIEENGPVPELSVTTAQANNFRSLWAAGDRAGAVDYLWELKRALIRRILRRQLELLSPPDTVSEEDLPPDQNSADP